jgi:hypothetical protein
LVGAPIKFQIQFEYPNVVLPNSTLSDSQPDNVDATYVGIGATLTNTLTNEVSLGEHPSEVTRV